MSFVDSVSPSSQARRRFHGRRRLDGLAYVEFGPDNGAILIDLGEGGLGFQSVMPVIIDQALLFKFKLPAESEYIEGFAEVAWTNASGKGGGLRFVELSADVCAHIREWTGKLPAPDSAASPASNGEQENAAESAAANPVQESPAPETINVSEVAALMSEASTAGENAQPSSTENDQALEAAETADSEAPADQVLPAQVPLPEALPIPEFTLEVAPAPVSSEALAGQVEWTPPAPPLIVAASMAGVRTPEPALPPHERSAHRVSDVAKTTPVPRQIIASEAPAKAVRTPAPDAGNFVPVRKSQRKPAPAKPESTLPPAYRPDAATTASFVRRTEKPVPSAAEWGNAPAGQEDEFKPRVSASPALKIGVGAAAGAALALALVAGVPALRTRVQATANAKSGGPNPASLPFQIEVADLNNRRWILKSGGEAGSPFAEPPSRRETQSAASARSEAAKSSRSEDSENSGDKADTPQPRQPKPGELALSRPHATPSEAASTQTMAPSIFDGITPPIGSVSDRLETGGPEAPAIVQPESRPSIRTSALQAAVLVQRVAPLYPSGALSLRLEGNVLVNATIGTDGVPKNLKALKGDPLLIPAALTAIRQWRYRPATLAGQAIETQIDVTVNFQLK